MATVALTASATELDAGTAYDLTVLNTGASAVRVQVGSVFDQQLGPGRSVVVHPQGQSVTAFAASGEGEVETTVATNPQPAPSGGTSVAPESWLMAFTPSTSAPLVGSVTLLFDPTSATIVGDDLTLVESVPDSGEFDTVLVNTTGRYRIRVELSIMADTGTPTGYLFVDPWVTGPVSPSYWSEGNNADGVAVNASLTSMVQAPVPLEAAEAYIPAGSTIQVNPVYADVADATVKLRFGTSLYVLRTA